MFKIGIAFSAIVSWCSICLGLRSQAFKKYNHDYFCRFSYPSYWRWTPITICGYYSRKLFENTLWLFMNYVADDIPLYTLGKLAHLLEIPVHLLATYRRKKIKIKNRKCKGRKRYRLDSPVQFFSIIISYISLYEVLHRKIFTYNCKCESSS